MNLLVIGLSLKRQNPLFLHTPTLNIINLVNNDTNSQNYQIKQLQEIEYNKPKSRGNPRSFRLSYRYSQYYQLNNEKYLKDMHENTKVEIVRTIAKAINSKNNKD